MGGWPEDPTQRKIGLYYQMAVEQDAEGYMSFLAAIMGWTRPEITVFAAHFKRETRDNKVHGYFPSRLIYGRKPA